MTKHIYYALYIVCTNIGMLFRRLMHNHILFNPLSFISTNAIIKTSSKDGRISVGRRTCIRSLCEIYADGGRITIGNNCFFNRNCNVIAHMMIDIHDNVTVGPNVCIYDHDHDGKGSYFAESVVIEENVWIGANSVICKGVHIGKNAVIAAGAVVTHNVQENSLHGGVPAKPIKYVLH